MDLVSILATVGTSAAVSGLVSFALKTYFKTRLEATYKQQLEKYKADLLIRICEEQERSSRRQEEYAKLVELVYRIRNMARDLVPFLTPGSFSLLEELSTRTGELEESLYKYRIDLERDGVFINVHAYKNICLTLCRKLGDMKYFIEHQEEERARGVQSDLKELYDMIEGRHGEIVHELSEWRETPASNESKAGMESP
jgi:hypothetical protein